MYRNYNARPIPHAAARRKKHKFGYFLSVLVLVPVLYFSFVFVRPLPDARVAITPPVVPALVKVNIPWPTSVAAEQAAFGADGYGLLAARGPETPVPTASVAKVITALVVLEKKPLTVGSQGPAITISARDVQYYNEQVSKDGSVVPVRLGDKISEYQALQALMLPSANNVAETIAEWAFGSIDVYNIAANAYVKKLGMNNTTVTDPSGLIPTTVSTASDLVLLGDEAIDNPVLAEIIAQQSSDFPGYGTIRNVNSLLGKSGIRGIKTGNTDEAGGCFLTAADVTIDGKRITVITAVMSAANLEQAMRDTLPLVDSAPAQFQTLHVVRPGQKVGTATTPWGASSDIMATGDITVTAWAGTAVAARIVSKNVPATAMAHTPAGELRLKFNDIEQSSKLELARTIDDPTIWWRLSHPLL